MVDSNFITKDSGGRRETETGSKRDSRVGKGRFDLIPWDILEALWLHRCVNFEHPFRHMNWNNAEGFNPSNLFWSLAMLLLKEADPSSEERSKEAIFSYALIRIAGLYERGAVKYGDDNWKKGQPPSWYEDSCKRHVCLYLSGHRDEDHGAAAMWNIVGYLWTKDNVNGG